MTIAVHLVSTFLNSSQDPKIETLQRADLLRLTCIKTKVVSLCRKIGESIYINTMVDSEIVAKTNRMPNQINSI